MNRELCSAGPVHMIWVDAYHNLDIASFRFGSDLIQTTRADMVLIARPAMITVKGADEIVAFRELSGIHQDIAILMFNLGRLTPMI
jgi:hypothetical protein